MKLIKKRNKQKPRSGYAAVLHVFLVALLPVLAYVLIRLEFAWVAVLLLLLSKWRMFAVKSRHWPANFRANAVDIFFGLSMIALMYESNAQSIQLLWVFLYWAWLLFVKPRSTPLWIGVQALVSQAVSLAAVFYTFQESSTFVLVLFTWTVTYFSARHFLTAFDEGMSRGTAYAWAFFSSSIAWLSGHWLIFYGPVAQPALLLTGLGYGLSSMYYLEHRDKLTSSMKMQFVSVMAAVVLFLIVFSDWSDKTT